MVTIYTERGRVESETVVEDDIRKQNTIRMALICLGTGLLLSLIGAFNLNADVNDLTNNKVPYIQDRINSLNLHR